MIANLKIVLPKDENIINALVINTTNGDAKYVSIEDGMLLAEKLKAYRSVNLDVLFMGVGETQNIEFEEDPTYTYNVEVIPKRKETPTPIEFADKTDLYEIVVDKNYRVRYMDKEDDYQNTNKPEKQEEGLYLEM